MKLLRRLLAIVALAGVVLLSAANRQEVPISFDPFWADPGLVVTVPLYAVVFAGMAAGVLLAALLRPGKRSRR